MEDNAHHRPQAQAPRDASTDGDLTLEELAALETEVDNWLRPAARPAAASTVVEPPRMEAAPPMVAVQPPAMASEPPDTQVEPSPIAPAPPPVEVEPRRMDPGPPQTESEPSRMDVQLVSFEPNLRELAPRRPRRTLAWVISLGAIAAAFGAAMFVNQQEQAAPTPEVVASDLREPTTEPVVPGPASPEWKPVDMVFLKQAPAAGAMVTAPVETVEPELEAVEPPAETGPPTAAEADEPLPTEPPAAEVAAPSPAAAVPVKPKKTVVPKKAASGAKKTTLAKASPPPQTGRRLSDSERVNAAIAECHKTARDPSACNIRVCDVLGSSHPACRE